MRLRNLSCFDHFCSNERENSIRLPGLGFEDPADEISHVDWIEYLLALRRNFVRRLVTWKGLGLVHHSIRNRSELGS